MKKELRKIIVWLLVFTLSTGMFSTLGNVGNSGIAQAASESENYFSQGDFEGTDLRNWSWGTLKNKKISEGGSLATTLSGAGDNYTMYLRSEEAKRSGDYGFYVDGDVIYNSSGSYVEAPRATVKSLTSGATYKLTFWVKAISSSATVHLNCFQWTTDWGSDVSSKYNQGTTGLTAEEGWKQIAITFTMQAGRSIIQFDTICQKGQQIYIDDYVLELVEEAPLAGLLVSEGESYVTKEALAVAPTVWETWLQWEGSAGAIVSNTRHSLEINATGNPIFVLGEATYTFDEVTLAQGCKTHLAVEIEGNEVHCYIGGEKMQSITLSTISIEAGAASVGSPAVKLYSLAIFSGARTEEELVQDMARVEYTEEALLLACDFKDVGNDSLEDHSTYNNHLQYTSGDGVVSFDETGLAFDANDNYLTTETFSTIPVTYEAEICLSEELAEADSKYEYGGVILGNCASSGNTNSSSLSFEIHVDGHPGIYFNSGTGGKQRITFTEVDVRTGQWLTLAVTLDETNKIATCYVNGEQKQTVTYTKTLPSPVKTDNTNWRDFVVGGDYRYANEKYFRGKIKSVAAYYDLEKESLALSYALSHEQAGGLIYDQLWKRNIERPAEDSYEYSMAVVGDTQTVNWYGTEEEFDAIYDYIVDEYQTTGKMAYCLGLGDITEMGVQEREYLLAQRNFQKMKDAGLPYSIIRGNHDDGTRMDYYFPYSGFKAQFGGSYEGSVTNTWQVFEADGVDYMILCLDYFPAEAVLDWAKTVVDEHPNHNVILTTHGFLNYNGTVVTSDSIDAFIKGVDSTYPDNGLWDKLVSQCDNIKLVLSGHLSTSYIVHSTLEREGMSSVEAMLIDPQGMDATLGSTGLVAMFYFGKATDGKANIQVQYYSTVRKEYYSATSCHFNTSIDLVEDVDVQEATNVGTISSLTRTSGSATNGHSEITFSYEGNLSLDAITKFAGQVIDTSDNSRLNAEFIINTDQTMTVRIPNSVLPDEFTIPAENFVSYDMTQSFSISESVTTPLLVRLDFDCATDTVTVNYNANNDRTYLAVSTQKTLPLGGWNLYQGAVSVEIDGVVTKVQGTQALGNNTSFQFYFPDGSGDIRKTTKKIVIPEGTEVFANGVTVRFVNDFSLVNNNDTWSKNRGSISFEDINEESANENAFISGTFDTTGEELNGWEADGELGASEMKAVTTDVQSNVLGNYILFEQRTTGTTTLSGWANDNTTTLTVSELEGNKVLEAVIGSGKYFRCYGGMTNVDATKKYAMICRMKTTEGNTGKVKFYWRKGGTKLSLMTCDVTDEWNEYRLEIDMTAGTPDAIAWETGDNKDSTYYIDDMQLVEITEQVEYQYTNQVVLDFNNQSVNGWNMNECAGYYAFNSGKTGESGDYALALTKVNGVTPTAAYYNMTITAGEQYRVTFDAKASTAGLGLKSYFGGNGDTSQTFFELTEEWTTYHGTLFASAVTGTGNDNSKCFFQLYEFTEEGSAYIDNIKVERVTGEEIIYEYFDGYGTVNDKETSNVFFMKELEEIRNTASGVNLVPGMDYKLCFDIRTEDAVTGGDTPFKVRVGIDNQNGTKAGTALIMEHNSEWQTMEYEFTAPEDNTDSTMILFSKEGTGVLYLDNIILYKQRESVMPTDSLLANGATLKDWAGVNSIRCFNGFGATGSSFTNTCTKTPDVAKDYVVKFRADITDTVGICVTFGGLSVYSEDLADKTGWKDFTCVISPNDFDGTFTIVSTDGATISLDDVTIYEKYEAGDANGDGKVDVRDLVRYKRGFTNQSLFATFVFADITGIGNGLGYDRNGIVIDQYDLNALINKIMGA